VKKELRDLIPEFDLISDGELREKTLAVWERALEQGGWQPSDLLRMPFTLAIPKAAANLVEHVRANALMCSEMERAFRQIYGDRVKINRDHLIAGALLHDVGKAVEFKEEDGKWAKSKSGRYLRHAFSGVGLCYMEGIPEEVIHIVAVHSREGEGAKRSVEAIILHHSDFTNFESFMP